MNDREPPVRDGDGQERPGSSGWEDDGSIGIAASHPTTVIILKQLRNSPGDAIAWERLVDRYRPRIYRWCRSWSLQEADAEDVTQDVLARLARRIESFRYDPAKSFRAYVKTLTRYTMLDLRESLRRPGLGPHLARAADALLRAEAREDLARQLDDEFDLELLSKAMQRVESRVEPDTWKIFLMTTREGKDCPECAAELGLKVAAVYHARSRILKMLQEEVKALDRPS